MTDATDKPQAPNRWRCRECGSDKVQIALPAWFREDVDHELTYIEADAEADVLWWVCEDCGESDSGAPMHSR